MQIGLKAILVRATEAEFKALMLGGLDGDRRARGALLTALAPVLRAFFAHRLRDRAADVEDLVQDTLIAIHTRAASFDCARPFLPWAFTIARYKLIDHYRRRRNDVSIDGLENLLVARSFEAACGAQMDIDALLGTLSDKQAAAIRDTRLQGYSVAESAARTGLSESDVKVSIHRGLKALARRLGVSSAN